MPGEILQRILYLEDEPDIRTVAQLALETVGGFTVKVCSSGHEALEKAAAFCPDLMLLDAMLPGLDGPATLAALRKLPETAGTPVVFMTAKVQRQEIDEFEALGALGVIAKPFDPISLPEQLRDIWKNRDSA